MPKIGRPRVRRSKQRRRVSFSLHPDVVRWVRAQARETDQSFSMVVEAALVAAERKAG